MESFSIRTTLTLADWRAYQRVCALRVRQRQTRANRWPFIALWLAVALAAAAVVAAMKLDLHRTSVTLGVIFGVALMIAAQRRAMRLTQPREGGSFLSSSEHEFSAEGITSIRTGARSFNQWQRVSEVTATAEHIYIWLDTLSAYVIPVRDLPAGMTTEQVVAAFKGWMAAPTEVLDPPAAPTAAVNRESGWRTAFRLLTLRTVEHSAVASDVLSGRPLPTVVLALIALALWIGLSWFYYLPEPEFYPYSVPGLAWYLLAALAVAVTMAKRSHPEIAVARVYAVLAIVLPLLIAADFAIGMWVPERWDDVARIVLSLYAIVYCARGLQALTGNRQPVAVLGGFAVAAMFLWVGSALYVESAPWVSQGTQYAEESETDSRAPEELLFEQPSRIDASVARIAPATGDAPVGFFVGFAGFGEQRVFAEEIKFAARKFADRFDTADRTLLLINDRRDRETQPLATVTGLRRALKAIASKMRLDTDVLFLALSSHGSEDPLLSVQNGVLPLRNLTGDALAEALDASGIKWRVIVISACHAGAFIESLRDPYTIVITAASPDRTSFGCSDDRDLTYFGEAFFRDSLPRAASLRDAFDTATGLVSEREAKEGFEASNPQAFFGENIEPRLASMLRATWAE
jgi:hypothetical protein